MDRNPSRKLNPRASLEERIRAAHAKKPTNAYLVKPQTVGGIRPPAHIDRDQMARLQALHGRKRGRISRPQTITEIVPPPVSKEILITGGIGDFLALESFMTVAQKEALEVVYLATRAHKAIQTLLHATPAFPNLKTIKVLYDDWSSRFCFVSLDEVRNATSNKLDGVADWSINAIFPSAKDGVLPKGNSSFIAYTLADTSKFALPDNYVVICPYSPNDRRLPRDFNDTDWNDVIAALDKHGVYGVVLGISDDPVPSHPKVLNLSQKTTLPESIEILKGSIGYLGIDSCLSVLAAKLFNPQNLAVKSVNQWLRGYAHVYFSPHRESSFIRADMKHFYEHRTIAIPSIPSISLKRPEATDEITLNVVQGVGDIFWIYQKFSPYYKKINLNVCVVQDDKVQRRAEDFLKLLPKIETVNYKLVNSQTYDTIASTRYNIQDNMKMPWVSNYACNKPLELGVRLEDIDPGMEVEWNVDIRDETFTLPFENYGIVYVSGNKPQFAWTARHWAGLMERLYETGKCSLPLVFLGASYDEEVLINVESLVKKFGVPTARLISMDFAKTIHAIKRASYFVGYQSGLNIIADNFDIPQIMVYFPYLRPMINSWCKPTHAETGIFNGFCFDDSIECIASKISWRH